MTPEEQEADRLAGQTCSLAATLLKTAIEGSPGPGIALSAMTIALRLLEEFARQMMPEIAEQAIQGARKMVVGEEAGEAMRMAVKVVRVSPGSVEQRPDPSDMSMFDLETLDGKKWN